jgi:spermidine synthase
MQYLLLITIFVISTCGLIYELVAGTLASYLMGDSVKQFSTIIGTYLFAMGIGSFFSKFIQKDLIAKFIQIEILTGLVGGLSSALLFYFFSFGAYFQFMLYFLISITGVFVGMEIPIIMRILNSKIEFKDLVSKVFTYDYIGALLASIIFPIILIPHLNIIRTSVLFGLFNIGLAMYLTYYFKSEIKSINRIFTHGIFAGFILLGVFVFSDDITKMSESEMYGESIIYSKNSSYQRIVLTRNHHDYCLYLNNHLQFNSKDEYRYHEALVHPVVSQAPFCKNVLILGGGDGFAARELLKYPQIKNIQLVDLDPKLTSLFKENSIMSKLNDYSLKNPKIKVTNADAFEWLRNKNKKKYDVIIIDFPDPSNFSVGKLYTLTFFKVLQSAMHFNTKVVMQSTSPLMAKESFWCVNNTIKETKMSTTPYHTYVPSFGEWGYILFGQDLSDLKQRRLPNNLKYYTPQEFKNMKNFPVDMQFKSKEINRLENQILITLFEKEWGDLF